MGISTSRVVNTYIISRIIERIGDHAVRLAENIRKIAGSEMESEMLTAVSAASTLALSLFDASIVSFFKGDMRGSHKTVEKVAKLEKLCDEITVRAMQKAPFEAVSFRNMAESIRRTGEYAGDISESVINCLVEEEE
jgi:phosphate uptake regulator